MNFLDWVFKIHCSYYKINDTSYWVIILFCPIFVRKKEAATLTQTANNSFSRNNFAEHHFKGISYWGNWRGFAFDFFDVLFILFIYFVCFFFFKPNGYSFHCQLSLHWIWPPNRSTLCVVIWINFMPRRKLTNFDLYLHQ